MRVKWPQKKTKPVGSRCLVVQAHDPEAVLEFANPPGIDAREGNAREEVELTRSHVGHGGHVPATNVLVKITRRTEHCAGPTRATSNTKHTMQQQKNEEAPSEFKQSSNGFITGSSVGPRSLHAQSLRGIDARGKRACEKSKLWKSYLCVACCEARLWHG